MKEKKIRGGCEEEVGKEEWCGRRRVRRGGRIRQRSRRR